MAASLAESAFDLVYSVLALSVALGAALFVIMAGQSSGFYGPAGVRFVCDDLNKVCPVPPAWYLVWKLVLSKVPFFREILGLNPNPSRPPLATGKAAASLSKRRSSTYGKEGSLPNKQFSAISASGKQHPSTPPFQAPSRDGEGLRRRLSSSRSELPTSTRSSETPVPESDTAAEPTTGSEDSKGRSRVRFGADELVFEDDYIR
ncbi:MAG: hypothetical protein BJ554DRAFT_1917 [Olpidium bornovanus]|uniref:Uncharacterized protein n=1 Tax=Olpidium bornovanus TaxID=278681 RepID=A0A8H8A159_9FUNG|nr:MAG: hypothetical protein BJ554DRAFT_1917 [Olpidium bornovanus]